ncbi:hypothetical protein PCL_07396 [Purpureocillium lilacinum]|uniref:Tetratricopeptide-like helical n=1 Tax=Purpureocillium lilacinum TaxID=33203 RepID=A0A2U3DS69_PURLI|nr:hypothetical protein PCL_07396 [Purpureocillium lilacinum]
MQVLGVSPGTGAKRKRSCDAASDRLPPQRRRIPTNRIFDENVWFLIAGHLAQPIADYWQYNDLGDTSDPSIDLIERLQWARNDLRHLRWTCRFMYPIATKRLYRWISLDDAQSATHFLEALLNNPPLRNFVRHLDITSREAVRPRRLEIRGTAAVEAPAVLDRTVCAFANGEATTAPKILAAILGGTAAVEAPTILDRTVCASANGEATTAPKILAAILGGLPALTSLRLAPLLFDRATEYTEVGTILRDAAGQQTCPPLSNLSDLTLLRHSHHESYWPADEEDDEEEDDEGENDPAFPCRSDLSWLFLDENSRQRITSLHLSQSLFLGNGRKWGAAHLSPLALDGLQRLKLSHMLLDGKCWSLLLNNAPLKELDIRLAVAGHGNSDAVARDIAEFVKCLDTALPKLGETLEHLSLDARRLVDDFEHSRPGVLGLENGPVVLTKLSKLKKLKRLLVPMFLFKDPQQLENVVDQPGLPVSLESLELQEIWQTPPHGDGYGNRMISFLDTVSQQIPKLRASGALSFKHYKSPCEWGAEIQELSSDMSTPTCEFAPLFPYTLETYSRWAFQSLVRDPQKAIDLASKFFDDNETSRDANILLARIYVGAGKPKDAQDMLMKLSPPPMKKLTETIVFMQQCLDQPQEWTRTSANRCVDGVHCATEWLGVNGYRDWYMPAKWILLKAKAHLVAGEPGEALQDLNELDDPDAANAAADTAAAHLLKSRTYRDLGNDEMASTYFDRALGFLMSSPGDRR